MIEKTVSDTWLLTETVCLDRLTVEEGGSIQAPAGKFVTMTVGGIGRPIVPGTYTVKADSSSSMFRITDCELTVPEGDAVMQAFLTLSGSS